MPRASPPERRGSRSRSVRARSTARCSSTVTLGATGAANNNTYASQTAPLTFTGNQRLFLVFRAVPGGPTTGMGNVNWVEFGGAGVTP